MLGAFITFAFPKVGIKLDALPVTASNVLLLCLEASLLRVVALFLTAARFGAGAAVAAVLAEAAFDGVFIFPPTATNFWLVIGVGLGAATLARRATDSEASPTVEAVPGARRMPPARRGPARDAAVSL